MNATLEDERGGPREKAAPMLKESQPQDTTNGADGKPLDAPQVFDYYKSKRAKKASATVALPDLIDGIRFDEVLRTTVEEIRSLRVCGDDVAASDLKGTLPAFTISAVVKGNRAEAPKEGRMIHTGFIQVDLDGGYNVGWTVEEMRDELIADEHIQAVFVTPSGEGVKGLFRISPIPAGADIEAQHKHAFAQVAKRYKAKNLTIDSSCCDPVRLAFLSHDREAWQRAGEATPMRIDPLPPHGAQEAAQPLAKPKTGNDSRQGLVLRSGTFPEPPQNGIHTWLMEAAWHCRLNGMSEADTVAKLESYNGRLRRTLQPTEARDAARTVFSAILQPYGTRATIDRIREAALPADFPDLTRFGESDADNALRVHAVAGGNFHHVAESGQWLIWDGCRWNPDKDGKMVRLYLATMEAAAAQAITMENRKAGEALVKHAMRCRDAAKVASSLTMLRAVQGVTISAADLDADPWLLGTPSGLIDLRTGQPIAPDKRALVTKSIACDFDTEAACPTWERVIHTAAAGDAELIRFLQAWTGYTLTGSVKEECLAFLHGTGANSKGTVTECIRALMGDYAMTAPESLFVVDRNSSATNDIARLSGCRMACAAELDESASFAESRLKAITGRDAITARFLHREFFDFQPTHKFWISGNHKPSVRGVDHGIWRRIRLIPFTVTIPKEERDLELADKLRAELPGILNWAIAGCLLWQREGLQTPQCVAKATADYQAAEDVVGQFLDDCTDTDTAERTLQSSLYQSYQAWAEKQGIKKPLTATILNRKFEERGMKRGKVQGGIYWHEIAIKSD